MEAVYKSCFYLFVGFLPFGVKTILYTPVVYSSGFFNPFLSHFLYLSDVFLLLGFFFLALAFLFGKKISLNPKKINLKFLVILGIFVLTYISSIIFAVDKVNTLFYILRLIEFLLFFAVLFLGLVDLRLLKKIFIAVVGISAFIGIFQYVFQHSLGLQLLGEPLLAIDLPQVAKISLGGEKFIRGYGTFSHPNVFAAYILMAMFFLNGFWRKNSDTLTKLFLGLIFSVFALALLITFSRSAIIAFALACSFYYLISEKKINWRYVFLFLAILAFFVVVFDVYQLSLHRFLLDILNDPSMSERHMQFNVFSRMFWQNIFGVGVGNFTILMQDYFSLKLMPWNFQPVHNTFALIAAELGVFGILSFVMLMLYLFVYLNRQKMYKYASLFMAFVALMMFDHYFVTQYQGQALFWLFLALTQFGNRSLKLGKL